jgi:hypothetical protein
MTSYPTFASLSSYPVGLFYSYPALADGGSYLLVISSPSVTGWRNAGRVF